MASEAPQSVDVLGTMLQGKRDANELWNEGIEIRIQHGKEVPEHAIAYFQNCKLSKKQMGELFYADGSFKFTELDKTSFDYDSLSPEQLDEVLEKRYERVYAVVNKSLDFGHEKGYNAHDAKTHVKHVVRRALQLVRDSGGSIEDQKLAVAIGWSHDLFNLISRGKHAFGSSLLAFAVAPELATNSKRAFEIKKGIILHDEKTASMYRELLATKHTRGSDEYYASMREKFGVATLAVLAADKADVVDRRRVTEKDGIDSEILIQDIHTAVSILGKTDEYLRHPALSSSDHEVIQRNLRFAPGIAKAEEGRLGKFTHKDGKHRLEAIQVPDKYHEIHMEGFPHLYSWLVDMAGIHGDRLGLEAEALFAINPKLDSFLWVVEDNSLWQKRGYGSRITITIPRDEVESVINFVKTELAVQPGKPWKFDNMPTVLRQEVTDMNQRDIVHYLAVDDRIEHTRKYTPKGKPCFSIMHRFDRSHAAEEIQGCVGKLFNRDKVDYNHAL